MATNVRAPWHVRVPRVNDSIMRSVYCSYSCTLRTTWRRYGDSGTCRASQYLIWQSFPVILYGVFEGNLTPVFEFYHCALSERHRMQSMRTIGVPSLRDVLIQEHGQGALTFVAKSLDNCLDKNWGPQWVFRILIEPLIIARLLVHSYAQLSVPSSMISYVVRYCSQFLGFLYATEIRFAS